MDEILNSFDENKKKFESFSTSLKSLLNSLLLNDGVIIHSLESRVKERGSLEKKLITKNKYKHINEVTDIVGLRIITHYAADVEKVAKLVEREFKIDRENSIDKSKSLAPDRFGYLSLHYVISLNDNRATLLEHKGYKKTKAEIQIRTILQHAWAEIEHDIGYKSNKGLPDEIRRQFSRLAGLLEMADKEFTSIRKDIEFHRNKVSTEITSGEKNIPVDRFSLSEYVSNSKYINEVVRAYTNGYGLMFTSTSTGKNMDEVLNALDFFKIKTISEIDELLSSNLDAVMKRAKCFDKMFLDYYSKNPIDQECIILYLLQVVAAKKEDLNFEVEFLNNYSHKYSDEQQIAKFFNKLRESINQP
ncbi:TPA: GTP pyrophosphokinase [Serratia fonticola]